MASPHSAATPDPDRIESADGGLWASILRILKLLARPELAHWRFRMGLAVFLTAGAKLFEVIAPVLLGNAINLLSGEGDLMAALPLALGGLTLFAAARFASGGLPQLRDAFFSPVSQDAQRLASVDAFRHAQHLSLNFHQTRRTGALNRVIERGAGAIDYLIRFLAFNIGPTFIGLILAATVLAITYDWRLALVAVATVAVYVVFTVIVTEWRVKQRREMNKADTSLRAISIDTLTNFETVKAFAAEERETFRYDAALKRYNKRYVTVTRSMNLLNAGQEFIMNLGLLGILAVAAWQVADGPLRVGDITAAMLLLFNLYRPLNILGWAWREIKQGAVDLEKLYGLMEMAPEVADRPDALDLGQAEGHVRFENVGFSHEGRAVGVQGIDIDVPAGRSVAFVGTSGAGKSTLLKLLFRFYDVEEGRVLVDGQDVRNISQASLRRNLGLVPQDVVLFNDTIRANVAYARPEASEAEIEAAMRQAQLLDFVKALPDGLETRVGERGLKLSGGEKQRVGIARVILADPAILVLDEATSALDSGTEAAVQAALEAAARGRTSLIVAHRLSTVQHADEIIVLESGQIIERGSHGDLIARNGAYAEMWARQATRDRLIEAAE
ncbi:MAG: ABC transporter ATP-binding protein/permease [Hyphomonadaceae bacterium]|nr:ABC transporter ATP-binding protein/permease [Hyphomonadaceae bacterium]